MKFAHQTFRLLKDKKIKEKVKKRLEGKIAFLLEGNIAKVGSGEVGSIFLVAE